MAILGKSKICPFKEDPSLIKKINYKEGDTLSVDQVIMEFSLK